MATPYGERHDSNEAAPPAKRRADSNQMDGQIQQASSIVQHADVMAHLISHLNDPNDVERLLMAADRYKTSIMSQVSSICFTEQHYCNIDVLMLAARFVRLRSCIIKCGRMRSCIIKCNRPNHGVYSVTTETDWPRLTSSLQHLYIPHVPKDVVCKLLGEANHLVSLRVGPTTVLPLMPSLQKLHLTEVPNFAYFDAQMAQNLPLLEELLIGPFSDSRNATPTFAINLQDFDKLSCLTMHVHGNVKLQTLVLPPQLGQLNVTPVVLDSLKNVAHPNLTKLRVLQQTLISRRLDTVGALSHVMPNLECLSVETGSGNLLGILTLEPNLPESMPQLKRISTGIVASFPECWPYLAQLRGTDRQIDIIPDGRCCLLTSNNAEYHAFAPPFSKLYFSEVPMSNIPEESLCAAKRIEIVTPYWSDWDMLSNNAHSTFVHLTSLAVHNIETVLLTHKNFCLAPLVSLKVLSLRFTKFQFNCLQKMDAITALILSISSNQLMLLKIVVSNFLDWYTTLAEHSLSSVNAACLSWSILLQKHSSLQYFYSDIPVIGLDEKNELLCHPRITTINAVIWRGKGQVFNDNHYMHLMNYMTMPRRFAKLKTLKVSVVQPAWLADSNTRCFGQVPSSIISRFKQVDPHWQCFVDQYPCLVDPKYLIIKLVLKDGVSCTPTN